VWFTGLPASGKSTLARRVRDELAEGVLLDSDKLRDALGMESYAHADRDAFYKLLGRLANMLARDGQIVLVAATAPCRAHRDAARGLAPRFIEVYVRTPLEVCVERDVKRLYARASKGEVPHLPGVGDVYEPPLSPDAIADGGHDEVAAARIAGLVGTST
jgi:adenylylsulfate kinase